MFYGLLTEINHDDDESAETMLPGKLFHICGAIDRHTIRLAYRLCLRTSVIVFVIRICYTRIVTGMAILMRCRSISVVSLLQFDDNYTTITVYG